MNVTISSYLCTFLFKPQIKRFKQYSAAALHLYRVLPFLSIRGKMAANIAGCVREYVTQRCVFLQIHNRDDDECRKGAVSLHALVFRL